MNEASARALLPGVHTHRIVPTKPADRLEFAVTYCDHASRSGALLCSPQPFLGGDLDNNVVRTIAESLATSGRPVLRFNYRAVGKSHDVTPGQARFDYWKAVEETVEHGAILEDCAAALERARDLFTLSLLGGYSFGAYAAMRLAIEHDLRVPLVLVAPPLSKLDFSALDRAPTSRFGSLLMIFAGDDALDPTPKKEVLAARFGAAQIHILPHADHFFRGDESVVAGLIREFAAAYPSSGVAS